MKADLSLLEGAQKFVDAYYKAFNSQQATIASFYQPPTTAPDGKPLPTITFNGDVKENGTAMQDLIENWMPQAQFEVQAVDAQCLNPNYVPEGTTAAQASSGNNTTILITISGHVKFEDSESTKPDGFNDNMVIVPNHGPILRKGPRHSIEYMIQTQILRISASE